MTLEPAVPSFAIAALALGYPEAEAMDALCARPELRAHPGVGPLLARLQDGIDAVRGDYLGLFDVGKERVPLYGTEYGRMRGLAKGNDLADILGFYAAFGLDMDADAGEMPDHLAIELEFYCVLLSKAAALAEAGDAEGVFVVDDARRKFLTHHLGPFPAAVARRAGHHPLYGPLLRWTAELVAAECSLLGVAPAPHDFFEQPDAEQIAECGGCVDAPGIVPLR